MFVDRALTETFCDDGADLAYRTAMRYDPCAYCGKPSDFLDHIHPESRGGATTWENLTGICRRCNSSKNDRSVLVKLGREPARREVEKAKKWTLECQRWDALDGERPAQPPKPTERRTYVGRTVVVVKSYRPPSQRYVLHRSDCPVSQGAAKRTTLDALEDHQIVRLCRTCKPPEDSTTSACAFVCVG